MNTEKNCPRNKDNEWRKVMDIIGKPSVRHCYDCGKIVSKIIPAYGWYTQIKYHKLRPIDGTDDIYVCCDCFLSFHDKHKMT